jgi:membrane protein
MERSQARNEAQEDGRGRNATGPTDIPAPGWKDIFRRVYEEIGRDRVLLVAAGVTFYLLLAFAPALAALISLYGLFADPATISEHVSLLQGMVPGGAMEILEDQLTRLSAQGQTKLGLTSGLSLAVALWSANAGVKSLFDAMNVAYGEEEKRSFLKLNLVSLAFTISTITAVIVLVGAAIVLPVLLEGFGEYADLISRIASIAALAVVLIIALAALYRWGPSRETAKWRWITPGALLTIVVTIIASVLFSWYVANFGSYNATYGSLGTVVGFMTWMWITMIIVICGAELNSEAEHQTARDSTTGPEQPLGTRGARMADRVAPRHGSRGYAPQTQREQHPHQGLREHQAEQTRTGQEASADCRPAGRRSEGLSFAKMALIVPLALVAGLIGRRGQSKRISAPV